MQLSVLFGSEGWAGIILAGTLVTLLVASIGLVVGLLLGTLGALCKISGEPVLSFLAATYTTVVRGVPELIVVYLFYFGSSNLLTRIAALFGEEGFFSAPGILVGGLAIGFIAGALVTEVFRSAYRATSPGERLAARAFGMPPLLMFRRIVAPAVIRHALPGLGNVWVGLLKESSLVSATGVAELMRRTQVAAESTGLPFTFYLTAAVIYLVLAMLSGAVTHWTERHYSRGARAA